MVRSVPLALAVGAVQHGEGRASIDRYFRDACQIKHLNVWRRMAWISLGSRRRPLDFGGF